MKLKLIHYGYKSVARLFNLDVFVGYCEDNSYDYNIESIVANIIKFNSKYVIHFFSRYYKYDYLKLGNNVYYDYDSAVKDLTFFANKFEKMKVFI